MLFVPKSRYGFETVACCSSAACCSETAAVLALFFAPADSEPADPVPTAASAPAPFIAAATMSISQPCRVIHVGLDHPDLLVLLEKRARVLVPLRAKEHPLHPAPARLVNHRVEELHRQHVRLELHERV